MVVINESLRSRLEAADEKFKNTPFVFGKSGMSMAGLMSSRRSTMFASHLSQFKNLIHPEPPKVFTGMEKSAAKYSSGLKESKKEYEVIAKVYRYDESIDPKYNDYLMILYDHKKDEYSIMRRKVAEKLTENFGYRLDTSNIDSKSPGDIIEKGEVLYKSSSYDEDLNYGYGVNAVTMHTVDPFVVEDGIVISESFAKANTTLDVTTHTTSVNDNDILINANGTSDVYKPFPDVGEMVKNHVILSKKRIQNDHILFDMKKSELRNVSSLNNKNLYGNGRVIDITINCNKELEEYEENEFNAQFLRYLRMQKHFYQELFDRLYFIVEESGSKYTRDISHWYKVAKNYLDPEVKFKDINGNAFSNYNIVFTLETEVPISVGQKLVGRYGNKGVVSKIRPDEEMPVLDTGVQVDVLMNSLSPTNRLISAPLYELSITFITNRIAEHLITIDDNTAREKILFDLMDILCPDLSEELKVYYANLNELEKNIFYNDIYEDGMYVRVPILWPEGDNLYDRIDKCYERFPDILIPYDVYVYKHGRMHKMMGTYTGYVGEMYFMLLKHTSQKDFSTRSIGSINSKELPAKTDSAKKHKDLYAKTPIKFGYQETLNMLTATHDRVLAEIHMLYRSSVKGRRDFGKRLAADDSPIEEFPLIEQYVSRNVEIMNAEFKPIGIALDFHGDRLYVDASNDRTIDTYRTAGGALLIGSREEFLTKAIRERLEHEYSEDYAMVMGKDQYEEMLFSDISKIRNSNR